MRVLFYSKKCQFSKKILDLMQKNNILNKFKLICIEEIDIRTLPPSITSVPSLIAPESKYPLVGQSAFEYLLNKKYFDHPTNNVAYWKNKEVPKPIIIEDKKAQTSDNSYFGSLNSNNQLINTNKVVKKNALLEEVMKKRNLLDKEMGFK
jgi:hypothetical protein